MPSSPTCCSHGQYEDSGSLLSFEGDLLAFGCVFYKTMTGYIPNDAKADEEIEGLCVNGVLPDALLLERLRPRDDMRCWQAEYAGCKRVLEDLKGISA